MALGNGLGLENTDLEAVLILERDPAKRVEGNEWSEARRMLFEFSKLGKVAQPQLLDPSPVPSTYTQRQLHLSLEQSPTTN